jgi:uncharacterized membrane protein
MKWLPAQIALTILAVLTCGSLALGQDEDDATAAAYTYSAVNAPGASGTHAYAINNSGEIAGYITGGECSKTSDQTSCGFVDVKGKFTTVACELDDATEFFDMGNGGEVVGAASIVGGVVGIIWEGNEACFGLADPSGPSYTEAWGVAGGNVVGFYIDSGGNFQGFHYVGKSQEYKAIKCEGWADTRALGINNAGVVVGDVSNSTKGPFRGFISKSGKCSVFSYPKAASTSARGINKSGQISGWYTDAAGKSLGFVKTGSSFVEVNFPGATGTLAYHLNDKGQVAGWYAARNGTFHGFVATPK